MAAYGNTPPASPDLADNWSREWLRLPEHIVLDKQSQANDVITPEFVDSVVQQVAANGDGGHIDFGTLWKMLEEQQRIQAQLDIQTVSRRRDSTWELVVIQAILLILLVAISILWAFCCKKRCLGNETGLVSLSGQVVALARKLSSSSRDLPPSYSKVDLTSVGLTLDDHYNPPPTYDWALEDNLLYSGPPPTPTPGNARRISRYSLTDTESTFSSRRTSYASSSSSRKTSRVTFASDLESGPTVVTRGDSSISLPIISSLAHHQRRRSTKSDGGSRRVSLINETGRRKKHSVVEIDPKLEEELKFRLAQLSLEDEFDGIVEDIEDETQIIEPKVTLEIINETMTNEEHVVKATLEVIKESTNIVEEED